jgi:ferric-dicitrate binding protein FerR (iron transport regulator)
MAPQKYPRAQALIEKFLAGKCTPEELELLDSWYGSLGEDATEELTSAQSAGYHQQFLTNFRDSLPRPAQPWWKRRALKWSAAASFLILAGTGWMLWPHLHGSSSSIAQNKIYTVTNETSNIKLVTLPDSSKVWLNATASIRWKEDFNQKSRIVQLTGEGFFDVQGSTGKPFVIHTRDLAIQVLGTRFNVEAYASEGLTRVSLVQGKVKVCAVKDADLTTILKPGYAAAYNNGDKELNITETEAGKVAAWKNGAFSATDLSFKDAVTRLCNSHGYTVTWKTVQGIDKNISVMFRKESFAKMIDNLCYINRKHYRITNKEVTIF